MQLQEVLRRLSRPTQKKPSQAGQSPIRHPNQADGKPAIGSLGGIGAFFSSGVRSRAMEFRKKQKLFSQGDPATHLFYIQEGTVRLAVTSAAGKEAIVAVLGPGDFLGESCLVGQTVWIGTAVALSPGSALVIEKAEMLRVLHAEHELSDRFISYMVKRYIRTEEDLIDQLFNSSEKRLARALLLLARYGKHNQQMMLPKFSQAVLAEMVGTSRTRINFFMNKFRRLGFIEYNGGLKINNSLLSVVLRD
jgi:CRP/FNR family cyclic AMP-dependent transcriptional regulator